jgi:hypothetical protein
MPGVQNAGTVWVSKNTYLPLATDEQVFFPQALPKRFDVIITGNPAGRSGMVLEPLRGLKVGLFGPWEGGWDRFPDWSDSYCGGISDSETLNRFYNQARICLDMSFDQNLDSANFIVFNAMASGCLLVTNDKPALHDLFQPGIVPAYTADFRPVIDRYLSDPGGFAAVAALQGQEILRSYTFMHRATEMLAIAMEDDLR